MHDQRYPPLVKYNQSFLTIKINQAQLKLYLITRSSRLARFFSFGLLLLKSQTFIISRSTSPKSAEDRSKTIKSKDF